ncbi:ABC transporter permease [Microbacterium sp. A588]
MTWLLLIMLAAVLFPLLPIAGYETVVGPPRTPPSLTQGIDLVLGTDGFGRSNLSRCLAGARVSLLVGLVAGLAGFIVGGLLGAIAAYYRRATDAVISLIADIILAFPPLILLLALSAIREQSLDTLLVGLSVISVPAFLRLARANTFAWSSREFVLAARNMGASSSRILFREISPNVLPSLAVYLPIVIATLIVAEGSLSFLGLGVPPPTPSWGGMIAAGKSSIATAPYLVFVPAVFVFLTVFSLNQAGDALRRRFDPSGRL